ncbi:hypothetical protein LTR60_002184, partial [Cryomyces antarcticus]
MEDRPINIGTNGFRKSAPNSVKSQSHAPKGFNGSCTVDIVENSSSLRSFGTIGVLELLERDERPVFVLDLSADLTASPVYYNRTLRNCDSLRNKISGQRDASSPSRTIDRSAHPHFKQWMLKREGEADGYLNSTWYNGIEWVATTLQDSWRVISGNHYTQDPTVVRREIENTVNNYAGSREDTQSPTTCENGIRRSSRASQKPDSKPAEESPSTRTTGLGLFDCTNLSLPLQVSSPHLDLLRNLDWTATKLGPMETWSAELRWMCNVLMTDPRPAAMYWGQDKTILYNERYVEVIGKMHPWTMGKTFKTVWVDLLSTFEPVFTKAEETGQSSTTDDAMFFIDRNGYIEETYISWSMIPIGSENGCIAYYNPVIETTRTVIADRRLSSLLELGQFVAMAEEPKSFWPQLLKGLESNIHDFPFAILYSYMEEADDISMSSGEYTDSGNWTFEGAVGLPENHANTPVHLDSNQAAEEITSSFREAIRADTPTLLDTPLLGRLLKDVPSRSFGDL